MPDLGDLPAHRPLPATVRRDARRRLQAGLAPRSGRAVVGALALALTVLAVPLGAAVLTVGSRTDVTPAAGAEIPQLQAVPPEQMFDARSGAPRDAARRCTAAGGREAARWQPILTVSARGDTVVAYRTGSGARFCELTPATVALSAAASAAGDGTPRITYVSALGTVAGVTGPGTGDVTVFDPGTPDPMTESGNPAVTRDGVFVLPNTFSGTIGSLRLTAGATSIVVEAADLPRAVTPRTDRPQPAGDASSAAGRGLADCLGGATPPIVDPHAWQPGAVLALNDNERILLGRYHDLLAVCVRRGAPGAPGTPTVTVDEGGASSGLRTAEADGNALFFTRTVFYGFRATSQGASASDTVAVTGLVKDPRVATVSISRPHRAAVTAPVTGGTFILPGIGLNEGAGPDGDRSRISALDSQGRPLGSAMISS
ncbi:hypothetical protein [Actinoplanes auranticolor]|uniref:Uncharacterized protein n=1 Tax=Actinoplanes auranticolor TaxID=47988 RepID=A0A919SKZ0_9ACTN|nr:hypothetical protein [Actinoplanes auranticolor]GIM73940.1 hypothetical protein Aau02nite_58380 [Actinoplanes auranticolor]